MNGAILASLTTEHIANPMLFAGPSKERVRELVMGVPSEKRCAFLLHVYRRYREVANALRDDFSLSTILESGLSPNEDMACATSRASYHHCGHGSDVVLPMELVEKAYHEKPYSEELFDAALAYRETLGRVRHTTQAQVARIMLLWLLWHDVA